MDWIKGQALALLFAAIPVGAIAFLVVQWIKRGTTWVDGLSPTLKRGAVVVIAAAVTALGAMVGVPILCPPDVNCLTALDQETVTLILKAVLGSLAAFMIHAGKSGKKAKK